MFTAILCLTFMFSYLVFFWHVQYIIKKTVKNCKTNSGLVQIFGWRHHFYVYLFNGFYLVFMYSLSSNIFWKIVVLCNSSVDVTTGRHLFLQSCTNNLTSRWKNGLQPIWKMWILDNIEIDHLQRAISSNKIFVSLYAKNYQIEIRIIFRLWKLWHWLMLS